MLGRALFGFVWLIIAAGVLLPLYPLDERAPGFAAAGVVLPVADVMASGCEGCAPADASGAGCVCPCHPLLPSASAAPAVCLTLTVYLVVELEPSGRSGEPRPLPPKLPTI